MSKMISGYYKAMRALEMAKQCKLEIEVFDTAISYRPTPQKVTMPVKKLYERLQSPKMVGLSSFPNQTIIKKLINLRAAEVKVKRPTF